MFMFVYVYICPVKGPRSRNTLVAVNTLKAQILVSNSPITGTILLRQMTNSRAGSVYV